MRVRVRAVRLRRGRAGQEVRGAPLRARCVLQVEEGDEARRQARRLRHIALGNEATVVRVRALVLAAWLGDEGRALDQLELVQVAEGVAPSPRPPLLALLALLTLPLPVLRALPAEQG